MAEPEWRALMARVQAAYGPKGEVSRALHRLAEIYRAVPVELERQLRRQAAIEDRTVAEVVVSALRRYLDEPPLAAGPAATDEQRTTPAPEPPEPSSDAG
jgi:hypothetical protein